MKKLALILVTLSLILIFISCGKSSSNDVYSQAINAYNDFLDGKIPAYSNEDRIFITDFENIMLQPGINQYALFDMNKDGIPELHISAYTYGIFSFENGKVIEVYKEAAGFETHVITNEPALISVHKSTGSLYVYTTIDKQNIATSTEFFGDESDFSYLLENPADVVWNSPQK